MKPGPAPHPVRLRPPPAPRTAEDTDWVADYLAGVRAARVIAAESRRTAAGRVLFARARMVPFALVARRAGRDPGNLGCPACCIGLLVVPADGPFARCDLCRTRVDHLTWLLIHASLPDLVMAAVRVVYGA